jgi:hypothetical protein
MAFEVFKKKWHRTTTIVLASLVLFILILAIFVNRYWSPILSSKVKEVVLKSSDGLYTVNFSSAELHVLRGTIDIFNITLKPDTAVYNQKKRQNIAPNNLVELHVKRLTLSHIHPFTLYFQHKLEIGEVILDEPVVKISYQLNHKRDTVLKDRKTAWQKISKSLRSIHIGEILLGDVKLKYEDYSGNKLTIAELKEMNLSARDLLIDSATQTDKSRLLYCKDIIAELNNYTGKSSNGLYTYKFNHLKLSTLHSTLNIEGLTLKPIDAGTFFSKSDKDRFSLRLDSLQLNNFDFLSYHKYRIITASGLIMSNGSLEVFGNPKQTKQLTDRVVTFPNVGLYQINSDLEIDTAILRHIDVFYNEYNSKSNETGTVSFNNTSGSILNITTRPEVLQKNNKAAANLVTYFMNRAKFTLNANFNLTDNAHSFSLKGNVGPMSLKYINTATMPLTMVKITSGDLKQMNFDIKADQSASHGKIEVLYNDLKVRILKTDTILNNLKGRPLVSLYANIFIIKQSNPDIPGGIPRSFYVNYKRPADAAFFKFVWQTLLAGIKPAAGLDKEKQDQVIALKNELLTVKQDRIIKKQKRLVRRAARRVRNAEKQQENGG